MESGPGPTVRRRQLGKMLRALRLKAGKKPEEVAAYVGLQRQTVTRIEQGKQAILGKNVRFMCQLYDVGAPLVDTLLRLAEEAGERGWWVAFSDTMPDWFADYVGLEADADGIWSYESEVVPGLLQIPDYTRAVTRAAQPQKSDTAVEQSAQFRAARQERLYSDGAPRLHFIVNEAALRREAGGPGVMARQVAHIRRMVDERKAVVQVLTFAAGAHAAMTGAFSMLKFPDDLSMNVVYLEHERGAGYLERPTDLERYGFIFDQLCKTALSPEDTHAWLASLEDEHNRANERGAG